MSHNIHEIPELDRKGLREFGLVTGAIVAGLFGLFFPWLLDFSFPVWPWVVFLVLGTWGLVAPLTLNPIYRIWMRFGILLSRITTPVILGIVYYLVITPFSIVMRAVGRQDQLARKFDQQAKSYRVVSKKAAKEKMEKPF